MKGLSYINKNGKKVSGAAAESHFIKQNGGLREYTKKVAFFAVSSFVNFLKASIEGPQKLVNRLLGTRD
jgi:hypothetical protein